MRMPRPRTSNFRKGMQWPKQSSTGLIDLAHEGDGQAIQNYLLVRLRDHSNHVPPTVMHGSTITWEILKTLHIEITITLRYLVLHCAFPVPPSQWYPRARNCCVFWRLNAAILVTALTFRPCCFRRMSKVPTITAIGVVLVAIRNTRRSFQNCCHVLKVLTVTGIRVVLI